MFLRDAVFVHLARDQILVRDAEFFLLRVPRDVDDLHAIPQGGRIGSIRFAVVTNMTSVKSKGTPR